MDLNKLYTDPNSPACYAGVDQLYREAKKLDPTITKNKVREFLQGNRTYTLHKPRQVNFKRAQTVPSGFMTDVQCDLADFQKLSRYNKGNRYMLVGIDVLSKLVFVSPTKSKTYKDMRPAFDDLLSQMPMHPHRIFTDRGGEFESKEMRTYFKEKGILKHKANTSVIKAALAERSIRNLKQRLYRYFSDQHSLNWIDVIPKIVNAINHSKSRVTGMCPADVNFKNAQSIWEKVYGNSFLPSTKKPRYKKKDTVRMAADKGVFAKGYLPNFSDEIVEIAAVKKGRPNTYKLVDAKGEPFVNNWYEEELARTNRDAETTYRIEKILRKRTNADGTRDFYVKFFEQPEREWIKESDIV